VSDPETLRIPGGPYSLRPADLRRDVTLRDAVEEYGRAWLDLCAILERRTGTHVSVYLIQEGAWPERVGVPELRTLIRIVTKLRAEADARPSDAEWARNVLETTLPKLSVSIYESPFDERPTATLRQPTAIERNKLQSRFAWWLHATSGERGREIDRLLKLVIEHPERVTHFSSRDENAALVDGDAEAYWRLLCGAEGIDPDATVDGAPSVHADAAHAASTSGLAPATLSARAVAGAIERLAPLSTCAHVATVEKSRVGSFRTLMEFLDVVGKAIVTVERRELASIPTVADELKTCARKASPSTIKRAVRRWFGGEWPAARDAAREHWMQCRQCGSGT
jgi:hypothetical protein